MAKLKQFNQLTEVESDLLFKAPSLIALLIAGADQNIDEKEQKWAAAVVNYRSVTGDEDLYNYYEIVETDFEVGLEKLIAEYPEALEARTVKISEELAETTALLEKLENDYAMSLVKSWRSFAAQIAKASGGFLGFGSVSDQEEQFIGLDMIKFG